MSVTVAATMTSTWDDLRRSARRLETEIDRKLVALNKLGHRIDKGAGAGAFSPAPSSSQLQFDRQPLLSGAESDLDDRESQFERLSKEISLGLDQLAQINEQLNTTASGSDDAGWTHTLRRHNDILRDYRTEFDRTGQNIRRALNREKLMGSVDLTQQSGPGLNRRADFLYKEHDHIRSSDRMLDDQISIAMSAKEHLTSQKMTLKDVSKKLNTLAKRYPAINSLMHKIQFKKRKDKIIIALVISVSLFLMFLYAIY